MPGILPMKVIKVGTSAQTRIAQACDRCRSKKIRCDGLRPCTQCGNVGFECKTSDKLSRRAFPRGYTESLEERVRSLENEVRELKDLLDEKDEKIDMLSKMYDRSPQRKGSSRRPSLAPSAGDSGRPGSSNGEHIETFKIQQPQILLPGEQADSVYMGSTSSRALVDSFKLQLQESGKQCSDLNVDELFGPLPKPPSPQHKPAAAERHLWRPPPRLQSDQMITVYFQEWAPLFPVVHRPSFLSLYEKYVTNPDTVQDKHSLAQLNLVFSVASLSNESRFSSSRESFEKAWTAAHEEFITEQSMVNLQCLILAQIYSIQSGDTGRLLYYKSLAVGIAQRLGLHLSQKRFALGALTSESRKKVFWTLYTLDCFSAAYLGLPKSLRDADIHCEYPADVDDEYVTEKGFQPTLPGECTRLSSALALFRLSRILSKVLDSNFSSGPSQELSFQSIGALGEELDAWSEGLAPHLKLEFTNDKPSTQVISSRCPLLSMTYHYIRTLIHRPAVCANLGQRASSSVLAMATSSKHLIQIIQLLDERKLSFTHCLNKNELLLLAGFGVLLQTLGLEPDSKMMKDNQKSIYTVVDLLQRRESSAAPEFSRFVLTAVSNDAKGKPKDVVAASAGKNSKSKSQSKSDSDSAPSQLEALAARYTLAAVSKGPGKGRKENRSDSSATNAAGRRSSKSKPPRQPTESSESSLSPVSRSISVSDIKNGSQQTVSVKQSPSSSIPNLDYFQFPTEPLPSKSGVASAGGNNIGAKAEGYHDSTIWEKLLNTLDENQIDNVDDFYRWSSIDSVESPISLVASNTTTGSSSTSTTLNSSETAWSGDMWTSKTTPVVSTPHNIPQSVFSFSDESLTSGDDIHLGDSRSTEQEKAFAELMISNFSPDGRSPAGRSEEFELLQREVIM